MTPILAAVLLLGLLAAAWSAGFFWTWSFTVMPGLGTAAPETAVEAMRRVNEGIRTPGFAFVFFGPAILAAPAAGLALVVCGVGVLWVTFSFNLPLNDGLAGASVTPETAGQVWSGYAVPWTWWNHLRAAASTAALLPLLAAAGLLLARR